MATVGTGLTPADFRRIATMPWLVILATLAHTICLPLVGLVVVHVLALNEFVMAGVLLVAACPSGSLANFYVYLARANPALTVTLTGISSLLAIVTMPFVLLLFTQLLPPMADLQVPLGAILRFLGCFLLLPIVLGMLIRHVWPALVLRHEGRVRLAGMAMLVALIGLVLWQAQHPSMGDLGQTVAAGAAMAVLSALAGALLGLILRLEAKDFWTVTLWMMVQNVALATTIAVSVYQQYRYAFFAVAYVIVQVPIASGLVWLCLKKQSKHRPL